MESTIIEIIISEAQNEVRDFQKWGFDIIPHRDRMKTGFSDSDGKTLSRRRRFQRPAAPIPRCHRLRHVAYRIRRGVPVDAVHRQADEGPHVDAGYCSGTTGVYPGKDCGVIVDYNGMLKSLRQALAQYALGDDEGMEPNLATLLLPLKLCRGTGGWHRCYREPLA